MVLYNLVDDIPGREIHYHVWKRRRTDYGNPLDTSLLIDDDVSLNDYVLASQAGVPPLEFVQDNSVTLRYDDDPIVSFQPYNSNGDAILFNSTYETIPVGTPYEYEICLPANNAGFTYTPIVTQPVISGGDILDVLITTVDQCTTFTVTPSAPSASYRFEFVYEIADIENGTTAQKFFYTTIESEAPAGTLGTVRNFQNGERMPILGATLDGAAFTTNSGRKTVFSNDPIYSGAQIVRTSSNNNQGGGREESFIYYYQGDTNDFNEVRLVFQNTAIPRTGDAFIRLVFADGTNTGDRTIRPTRNAISFDLLPFQSSLTPGWNRITLETETNIDDFIDVLRLRTQEKDGETLDIAFTFVGAQRRNPGLPGIGDGPERQEFTSGAEIAIYDLPASNSNAIDGDTYIATQGGIDFQRESDGTFLTIPGTNIGQNFLDAIERIPPDYLWSDGGIRCRRTPGGQGRLVAFVQPVSVPN